MMDARGERMRIVEPETADLQRATIIPDDRTNSLVIAAGNESFDVIKMLGTELSSRVLDRAIQAFGGGGLSQDYVLAKLYAETRIVRMADGPDEVHRRAVARTEVKRFTDATTPAPHGVAAHLAHVGRL